ncbi:MAG: NifU family protein [Oligoflexia bacterium]|nr:NifU family protein [Oligoflexia bacterium]
MSQSQNPVYVSLEFTPNPNTLKYSVNRTLVEKGAMSFSRREEAEKLSPLAAKLLGIPGISGVMLGRDFVTVTKTEEGDWDLVHKSCSQEIERHLSQNLPVLDPAALAERAQAPGDSEVERRIREILDQEIRPAVAMDGGDIELDRYENGIVYLYLQGSCAGCPSATMTLKVGIETRLKEYLPEIQEVVSI